MNNFNNNHIYHAFQIPTGGPFPPLPPAPPPPAETTLQANLPAANNLNTNTTTTAVAGVSQLHHHPASALDTSTNPSLPDAYLPPQPAAQAQLTVKPAPPPAVATKATANKATAKATAIAKKPKKDRKVVNGIRLRYCICRDPMCAKLMRRWALVGHVAHQPPGYLVLPVYKDSQSQISNYTNTYLQRCLVHLLGCSSEQARLIMPQQHAVKTATQVRVKFIAHVHFHPRVLDYLKLWHGKRSMHVYEKHAIPASLGKLLGLGPDDACVGFNGGQYYAVPNYHQTQFVADLELEEARTTQQAQLAQKVQAQDDHIAQLQRQIMQLQKRQKGRTNKSAGQNVFTKEEQEALKEAFDTIVAPHLNET